MKKKFCFRVLLFCCILLLLFAGCNKQPDQKNGTMQETEKTSELKTGNKTTQDTGSTSEPETGTEPPSFAFNGKIMEQMEKPDQIKIISEIRSQMGEEAIALNEDQMNTLTKKMNALHLKEYDYSPSNAPTAAGGGIIIEFYYGQEQVAFNFTSSNLIERQEQGKAPRHFKDDSGNYREFEELMITALLQ